MRAHQPPLSVHKGCCSHENIAPAQSEAGQIQRQCRMPLQYESIRNILDNFLSLPEEGGLKAPLYVFCPDESLKAYMPFHVL